MIGLSFCKVVFAFCAAMMAGGLRAGSAAKADPVAEGYPDWQGLSAKSYVCGREICPSDLRHKVTVVLREDISKGEQVDDWSFLVNDEKVLSGKSVGHKRIRILDRPMIARHGVRIVTDKGSVSGRLYFVNPELVKLVQSATTESGETDTAKWMTGVEKENR